MTQKHRNSKASSHNLSTRTNPINCSTSKSTLMHHTLLSSSSLFTFLTVGLVFALFPTTTLADSSSTYTTSSSRVTTSTYTPSTTDTRLSMYSDSLSETSPVFNRPNGSTSEYYYYQAILVPILTPAVYVFTSDSIFLRPYGYLYKYSIDLSYPSQNLITSDYDSAGNGQFRINATLQSPSFYVLVVTTYRPAETGSFLIKAVGPDSLALSSFTPTTSRPITIETTTSRDISTSFSDYLSSSSGVFFRPGASRNSFYYFRAIRVTVPTTDRYTFTSSSTMDTYGYFYYDPIDPSYPSQNLITSDDDSGRNRQFRISVDLDSTRTYVLLVTTSSATTSGSFSVNAVGPARVTMNSFTPSTSRPITTTTPYTYCDGSWTCDTNRTLGILKIVGISLACVAVFLGLLSLCIRQQNRRRNPTQGTRSQNIRPQVHRTTGNNRNASRANGVSPTYVEESPPTYVFAVEDLKVKNQNQSEPIQTV